MKNNVTIIIALLISIISGNTNFAQNDRCLKYKVKISKKNDTDFRIEIPSPSNAKHVVGLPQINYDNNQHYYYFGWKEVKGANKYKIKFFDNKTGKLIREMETSRICFCYSAESAESDFGLEKEPSAPSRIFRLEVEAIKRFKKRNKNDCSLAKNSVLFFFVHCKSIYENELTNYFPNSVDIFSSCKCKIK